METQTVNPNEPAMFPSDVDVELIKSTFKGNDVLLKSMRALFLGLEISEQEKKEVQKTFSNPLLFKAVKTRFLPYFNKEAEIGTCTDVWMGAEQMIFGYSKDTIKQAIQYKRMAIEMTERAMDLLRNPDLEEVNLDRTVDGGDVLGIKILATNQYVRQMENQLLFIKMIAGMEEPSKAQLKEKAEKASSE